MEIIGIVAGFLGTVPEFVSGYYEKPKDCRRPGRYSILAPSE